jgi:protein-S-isoprenylcysteine O-methyltransferase Ste14
VALQAALILGVVGTGAFGSAWPAAWRSPLGVAGAVFLLAGVGLLLGGALALGPALTPLPRPREAASLRDGGLFGFVRHPIYGAVMLLALGASLRASPWALIPTAFLVLVLAGKSVREERWLVERYPAYPAYRERVRRRFLPFIW